MKTKLLILLLLIVSASDVFSQRAIKDEDYILQRKSHFSSGWEHKPRWWYNLFYRRYQRDYNTNSPLWLIIYGEERLKNNSKQKEVDAADTISQEATIRFIDQVADVAYLVEYNTLDTLKRSCKKAIEAYRYSGSPDSEYNYAVLNERYNVLVDNIRSYNISIAESAQKREEYLELEKQFLKLIDIVKRLNRANEIINRHNN